MVFDHNGLVVVLSHPDTMSQLETRHRDMEAILRWPRARSHAHVHGDAITIVRTVQTSTTSPPMNNV
jgi:hypothetical protein